ncbi:DUF4870 domain-containing protein [Brevibacillus brevis]|uniref:DUF4870 domain-containing protein n=1 Tax=Brevibacillus brevis TaxID=1393 RepID=UPI0011588BE7|nr:DUF4870 domain-containing protein [Lysinibacillus sp. SDF0063]TQR29969.1 DUF4870 domain-containing protein [Lysinibacillus sp. SDF0063]
MDYRGVKVITHASTFFAPILVPILVWLLVQNRDAKNMALQALFFHIIMTVLIAISWFFTFLLIGIPFLIVFGLMAIYYPIKGILYSLNGRPFSYPFVGGVGR